MAGGHRGGDVPGHQGRVGLALALAHSRGLLDHGERVATYWPEFAWRGKREITVRQLLWHQAGLPVIDIPLTIADLGILTWRFSNPRELLVDTNYNRPDVLGVEMPRGQWDRRAARGRGRLQRRGDG